MGNSIGGSLAAAVIFCLIGAVPVHAIELVLLSSGCGTPDRPWDCLSHSGQSGPALH
jgi:hypothetical protein